MNILIVGDDEIERFSFELTVFYGGNEFQQ